MRRRRRVLPVTLLALALGAGALTGCGGSDGSGGSGGSGSEPAAASERVDPEATACRARWRDLADVVGDRAEDEHPSSLPGRWTSIAASIDYYATSAAASDCGDTLSAQRTQVADLQEFVASLRRHDVRWQHDRLEERVAAYTPPRRGRSAPTRKQVRTALTTMEQRAPRAERDQQPAWQQATVVDLGERTAVAKARKDLAFLSRESAAWRQARAAQRTLERAARADRG